MQNLIKIVRQKQKKMTQTNKNTLFLLILSFYIFAFSNKVFAVENNNKTIEKLEATEITVGYCGSSFYEEDNDIFYMLMCYLL